MSKEQKEKTEKKAKEAKKDKVAVILIRGFIGMTKQVRDTIFLLRLRKKHTCVVLEDTESSRGMIRRVKDYVTYGEIDDKTLKELVAKRGKESSKKKGRTKPFFELAPPKKGFERKGIKKGYKDGGALGYRGDKINDLIKRML